MSLGKRRGFIFFPSSDIYKRVQRVLRLRAAGRGAQAEHQAGVWWRWRSFVHGREDITGLDSSIIASPSIWEASGHVAGFSDPMVDCKGSKLRYRADQLLYAKVAIAGGGLHLHAGARRPGRGGLRQGREGD